MIISFSASDSMSFLHSRHVAVINSGCSQQYCIPKSMQPLSQCKSGFPDEFAFLLVVGDRRLAQPLFIDYSSKRLLKIRISLAPNTNNGRSLVLIQTGQSAGTTFSGITKEKTSAYIDRLCSSSKTQLLKPTANEYFSEKEFNAIDVSISGFIKGEYEACTFRNCNLASADLSDCKFVDCTFDDCNLSLANISRVLLRDVKFKGCKLLGLRFDTCNAFGMAVAFEGCQLNHASFFRTKIRKTIFANCQLQETDFSECDLTDSVFNHCDLDRAVFDNTSLEKCDFTTSFNIMLDPEKNRIRNAKFSAASALGLLRKYNIEIN